MSNSLKTTLIRGDNVRTGVTAIPPHPRNLLKEKLPGAVFVGNAFRKLIGAPALISGVGRVPSGPTSLGNPFASACRYAI
jgi:L-aminopeptidase/D-esterase-like protein